MDSLFFCHGIGDAIACDSVLTSIERASIKELIFANKAGYIISELFSKIPAYKKSTHVFSTTDFDKVGFIRNKAHFMELFPYRKNVVRSVEEEAFILLGNQVKQGTRGYTNSSFLTNTLGPIKHFNLPPKYITIMPFSSADQEDHRVFTPADWESLLSFLHSKKAYGVILNNTEYYAKNKYKILRKDFPKIPVSDRLLDLTNETTILEAIEIFKKGVGYWGIDSFLTVLAAKKFKGDMFRVKTTNYIDKENPILLKKKRFYFCPKSNYDFLVENL